jgi:PAS domain S-box-containing protein
MTDRLRALIAEDKPRDAMLMARELERAGFEVQWERVETEEAYRAGLASPRDLVLADGTMPAFDAIRALEIVDELGLAIPVIVITGALPDERAVEFMKHGAADYLLKDRLARLGQAVRQAVELRRREDEARRIEEERQRFFQLSRDMLCVAGVDGFFKLLNPAWEKTLGWTKEELCARPYLDFVHPDDRAATSREAGKLAGGGSTAVFENRYRCKDGSYKWLSWQSTSDPDRGLVYATARDMTEWRRGEEELREWRDRYAAAVKATGQILYEWAPASDALVLEGNLQAILGYSADELGGGLTRWIELVHPDDREAFRKEIERVQLSRDAFRLEYRVVRKDGKVITVRDEGHAVSARGAGGERMIGLVADVSEQKRLAEQLRQAQKMEAFGQLAGGVAHDFNNLLTIINSYSELLIEELPSASPMRELVDEIREAGERSAALTRQLLAFSRQQVIAPRALDLNVIVAETQRLLSRLIGEDILLRVQLAPGLWAAKADPGQVEQVILNLVVNARDAMPRGGTLSIETANQEVHPSKPGRFVRLAVSDTGSGMDAATVGRIFEPFFTTKGEKGTGLGLATVYGIVEQAGGDIEVDSEPRRGTTFRVYFPATTEGPSPSRSRQRPTSVPGGTETVLLAEDDEDVRALTTRLLKSCGYAVIEARSGAEAVEFAARHRAPIHLLLTDVVMPGLGGRETADQVTALHPETRVLFLSGYTDDAVLRHGVRQAEAAFLQKPFTPSALAQRIRDVLEA